jgi:hypothetical protein
MPHLPSETGLWTAKIVGAAAGAAVSLVYLLPKNRREAASRFFTGLSCGLIFGGPTGAWGAERLELSTMLSAVDIMLAGSAAASLCAWWGLGILARLADHYGDKAGG